MLVEALGRRRRGAPPDRDVPDGLHPGAGVSFRLEAERPGESPDTEPTRELVARGRLDAEGAALGLLPLGGVRDPRARTSWWCTARRPVRSSRALESRRDVSVRLERPGDPLPVADAAITPAEYVLEAPPGDYVLVVEGAPSDALLQCGAGAGRATRPVRVEADTTGEVELELPAGALLEVTLLGVPAADDFVALGGLTDRRRSELARKATLTLVVPGRPDRRIGCVLDRADPRTVFVLGWSLGETHLSERLPAGVATLVARLPGGRVARTEVRLVDGEVTRVTLSF